MSRKYSTHRSSLFLLELILAILFFSVASAICVQLFVKSHTLSQESKTLSIAVNECADMAEIIYSSNSPEEMIERLRAAYPNMQVNGQTLVIPYDDNTQTKIVYELTTDTSYTMLNAKISFEDIYSLDITHCMTKLLPKEGPHES